MQFHPSDKRWIHLFVWMPWICLLCYIALVFYWWKDFTPFERMFSKDETTIFLQSFSFAALLILAPVSHLFNKFYLLNDLQKQQNLSPGGRGALVFLLLTMSLIGAPIYFYAFLISRPTQSPDGPGVLDI